ncbi:hypothetical protein SAMN05216417_109100 [Nitrosospira multiformis]|uniref:Uncharacterized protein n=1 Tax=Nitrosospira multiformis TaxID=1231 RepID=A0A1I7HIQ8_9PROT|nr:hypothetical protein SAMN05216417_109100 [Nitrosospira multiformis]
MLRGHCAAAIQTAMASKPEIGLATLVHQLVLKVFSSRHVETLVESQHRQAYLKTDTENTEQSKACLRKSASISKSASRRQGKRARLVRLNDKGPYRG